MYCPYGAYGFIEVIIHPDSSRQDLHDGNVLQADDWTLPAHEESLQIQAGRVYLIDFAFSRQFELGPGSQPAVQLPDTNWPRPREGITHFDPYAWDVFQLGKCFNVMLQVSRSYIRKLYGFSS